MGAMNIGQVAQLVEQRTENPRVGSSILPLATISSKVNSGHIVNTLSGPHPYQRIPSQNP